MALLGLSLLQEPAQLASVWAKAQETHACLGEGSIVSASRPQAAHTSTNCILPWQWLA